MRLQLSALVVLVGLASAATGVILLLRSKRRAGWAFIAGAGVAIVLAVAAVALPFVLPDRDSTIWVHGLSDAGQDFTVELAHARTGADGETYSFGDAGTQDQVLDAFEEQHPEGTANVSGESRDGESPLWRGPHGDITVTLYGDGANYTVVSDVELVLGAHTYKVPMPADLADPAGIEEGVPFAINANPDDWRVYYSGLHGSVVNAAGITVPTSDGHTALITFADGTATLTR